MAAVWSEEARWEALLEVEVLAVEAWAELGHVPAEDAKKVRAGAPKIDAEFIAEVDEREAITNHDLAAFVDVVQSRIGPPAGNWVHYGLTSSDVVDTGQCLQLMNAADLLIEAATDLIEVLKRRADGVSRHGNGWPHSRHARRANNVRHQAGVVGLAG